MTINNENIKLEFVDGQEQLLPDDLSHQAILIEK